MKYLNALNRIPGIGTQKIKILLNHFQTAQNVWKADLSGLKSSGISQKNAEIISVERSNINPDEEWEKLQKENIKLITLEDPAYPKLLKEIPRAPYIIYTKGEYDFNELPMVAIVGSRKYTPYGLQVAEKLAHELTKAGIIVVSGMAIGIDAIAHKSVLEAQGKTVAVLGSGLDGEHVYPRSNFNLSREIISNGALVSEYSLGTPASNLTFPARNRIIAGLTLGTIVVEAAAESGALITSSYALEFNREVFSVPGSIFSVQSEGANNLIKSGAKLVASAKDVLEELDLNLSLEKNYAKEKTGATKEEEAMLKILSSSPLHIDNISKLSKLGTVTCSQALSLMEIKGWVKNIGGQNYILL